MTRRRNPADRKTSSEAAHVLTMINDYNLIQRKMQSRTVAHGCPFQKRMTVLSLNVTQEFVSKTDPRPMNRLHRCIQSIKKGIFIVGCATMTVVASPLDSFLHKAVAGDVISGVTSPTIVDPSLSGTDLAVSTVFKSCNPSIVNIFDVSKGNVETNGTGFIVEAPSEPSSQEAFIVTNYHVLGKSLGDGKFVSFGQGAPIARVIILTETGDQQQSYPAYLVGADKETDLAVVKITVSGRSLHPLQFETSQPQVGETVIAIGNPFGFDHSLTKGIVSALHRGFQSQTGSVIGDGIQSDAAINPGNSGSPLLNLQGRVIGINTAIFTNTGVSTRVSFAIPASTASRVVTQLIQTGTVSRPSLGIQAASDPIMRELGVTDGVMIQTVERDGPASRAGLSGIKRDLAGIIPGDVITAINGRIIHNVFDLTLAVESSQNEDLNVTVRKGGSGTTEDIHIILTR